MMKTVDKIKKHKENCQFFLKKPSKDYVIYIDTRLLSHNSRNVLAQDWPVD